MAIISPLMLPPNQFFLILPRPSDKNHRRGEHSCERFTRPTNFEIAPVSIDPVERLGETPSGEILQTKSQRPVWPTGSDNLPVGISPKSGISCP